MAWQLIYTSAPRLLEAGRTGFGTVARHRAVSALVASAVERISQFARLSGLDSRRVIYSHRIVTVGASQFHILSCIRDAGSDYTGRTNHLAHHLIAESREVAALIGQGPSPADVLLQMNWAQSWTSAPRFFDPSEEVPLAGFSAEAQGSTWEMITGRNDFAWLPLDPRMKRGCYLLTPVGADARELFHDSLTCLPAESWATTFTTSLEPNDDVSDFRWIALPLSSPLRSQLDTSARPVLNLTNPSTLPEPEKVTASESRAVSQTIREPSVERLNRSVSSLPPPEPLEYLSAAPLATSMGTMGDWSPAPAQRKNPMLWVILGAGMLCALGAITLGVLPSIRERIERRMVTENQAASLQSNKQVDDLLKELKNLDKTKSWLKKPENQGEIRHYEEVKSWITQQTSEPNKSSSVGNLKLQPDFQSYVDAFVDWRDAAITKGDGATLETWRNSPPSQILDVITGWLNDIQAKKSKVQKYDPNLPSLIEDKLSKAIQQRLGEIRTAISEPPGDAKEWEDLVQFLDEKDMIKKGPDHDWIRDWARDWARLSELSGKTYLAEAEKKEIRETASKTNIPWLKKVAQQLVARVDKGLSDTQNKEIALATSPEQPMPSVDDPAAEHPIQIADPFKGEGFKVDALSGWIKDNKMHLRVGEAGDLGGKLKLWPRSLTDRGFFGKDKNETNDRMIRIEAGRLYLPQNSQQKSWRIVGENDPPGKVLFELIVVPKEPVAEEGKILSLNRPVPAKMTSNASGQSISGQTMSIISRLTVLDGPHGSTIVISSGETEFQLKRDGVVNTTQAQGSADASGMEIKNCQNEIASFEQSINRFEQDLLPLNPGKRKSDGDKKAKIETQISGKKEALVRARERLQSLIQNSKPQTISPVLKAGPHQVYLKFDSRKYPLFDCDILPD